MISQLLSRTVQNVWCISASYQFPPLTFTKPYNKIKHFLALTLTIHLYVFHLRIEISNHLQGAFDAIVASVVSGRRTCKVKGVDVYAA